MDPLVPLTDAVAAVHADLLEEQGHRARADFLRVSLQFEALSWAHHLAEKTALGARLAALEGAQWAEACGALNRKHTWVGWKHGLPTELGVAKLEGDELAARQALTSMPWLEHLAFGSQARVRLRGVEQLRALRRLHFSWCRDVTDGFGGVTLPSLEFLSFEAPESVQRAELVHLATMHAPNLRRLHTRARDAAFVFSGIGAAGWFSQLTSWTHVVSSREELVSLLPSPALKLAGPTLTLRVPAALAEGLTLPHEVRLAIAREVPRYSDPDWRHSSVSVDVTASRGGLQWLAPWTNVTPKNQNYSGNYTESEQIGSGAPFEQALPRRVGWCGLCESLRTLAQHFECWGYDSDFERNRFSSWRYRCLDCGLFSSSGDTTVH